MDSRHCEERTLPAKAKKVSWDIVEGFGWEARGCEAECGRIFRSSTEANEDGREGTAMNYE